MTFLLDTTVLAELRKGDRANANVRSWFDALDPSEIRLSVVTVGEIRRGVENVQRRDPAAASALERWLARLVRDYGDAILPIDVAVAEAWGRLNVPNAVPSIDGLLAATAQVYGLTLATRNTRDVARTGIEVVNPFDR